MGIRESKQEMPQDLNTPIHLPKRYGERVILSQCGHTGVDRETGQKVYLQIPAVRMGNKLVCMASVTRYDNFAPPGKPVRRLPWSTYCGAEIFQEKDERRRAEDAYTPEVE